MVKPIECRYKHIDSRLKEQFINGINDQMITAEITRELLYLVCRGVEVHSSQKAMIDSIKKQTVLILSANQRKDPNKFKHM